MEDPQKYLQNLPMHQVAGIIKKVSKNKGKICVSFNIRSCVKSIN